MSYRDLVCGALLLMCSQASATTAMTCHEYLALVDQEIDAFYESDAEFDRLEEKISHGLKSVNQTALAKRVRALNHEVQIQKRRLAPHARSIYKFDVFTALSSACEKHQDEQVTTHYRLQLMQGIELLEENLEYLSSIQGAVALLANIPDGERRALYQLPHGQLCNRRDEVAYVTIAGYVPNLKQFIARGWQPLSPNRCMEVGEHQYSFISWSDRSVSATPPRRYSSVPNAHFCVKKGEDFTFYHANRADFCRRTSGAMKTFLKHGLETEHLQ